MQLKAKRVCARLRIDRLRVPISCTLRQGLTQTAPMQRRSEESNAQDVHMRLTEEANSSSNSGGFRLTAQNLYMHTVFSAG